MDLSQGPSSKHGARAIFLWTVGPRRLSFSGLGVLISTSSPEKDSLLAPMVHEKIAHEILKKEGFLDNPLLFHKNGKEIKD